jgi:hypothetical protein
MTTPTRISGTNLSQVKPLLVFVARLNSLAVTRKASVPKAT